VILPDPMLTAIEIVAMVTGVGYAVLAARRNRLCWLTGAVSAACAALLAGLRGLPMQSALQAFYVGMSVYGWLSWTRASGDGELSVGWWPWSRHAMAIAGIALLSLASAHWLAAETGAAWPMLDSLTTWFSLLATWLAARARMENWLYWIIIDVVLIYLFYKQKLPFLALLNVLFVVIAGGGFLAWRRRYRTQRVPA
jgi:nicotinamide mononucleotide transporter